jgi:hypothetical protein
MTMIIKTNEKCIASINGCHHDNYGGHPLDSYENISWLPN